MDNHSLLDAPVSATLAAADRSLVEGGPLAMRYLPEIAPFAAVADRTEASFAALAQLMRPGDRVMLHTMDALAPPDLFIVDMQASVVQMVLETQVTSIPPGPEHIVLGPSDVPDMLDLTARTRPGPFGPRTIELGRYIGLRIDGKLVAMAGERMRFDRFVEVSAVCVDPEFRGRGYAALLLLRTAKAIQERGLTSFLHVISSNEGAIALYQKLGFVERKSFSVTLMHVAQS